MFEIIHKIGKGSSGYVYKALNKKDGNIYALKQSLLPTNDELIKNEIYIYQLFKNQCPYIVKFYDYFKAKNELGKSCLCIQMEYCQYGSIREIIKKGKKKNIFINELEISSVIYMVLIGLSFVHKNNIIDRDIKGRNILVDKDGSIKLCDFGICKPYKKNKMKTLRGGSPYWMAPEVLNKEEYDYSIDIWALGITCIELAEIEPPYSKLTPKEVMEQIIKSPPKGLSNPSNWSKEFNDFISQCLNVNRQQRPTADDLLNHDFITQLDKKNLNRKLLILQFLSKCGYKIIYNRKTKIAPLPSGKFITNNKSLYHKKNLVNLKTVVEPAIKTIDNEPTINKHRISMKCSSIFNKKTFLRARSVDKEANNGGDNNTVNYSGVVTLNSNLNSIRSSSRYVPCLTFENKNYLKDNKINLKLENSNIKNNYNNDSNNNSNNIVIIHSKNHQILHTDENVGNDNEDEKINEIPGEEEEGYAKEKIIDVQIKNLIKERDYEINNIMLKYQDKISQMKEERNLLLRRSLGFKDNIQNTSNKRMIGGRKYVKNMACLKSKNDNNTISTTSSK